MLPSGRAAALVHPSPQTPWGSGASSPADASAFPKPVPSGDLRSLSPATVASRDRDPEVGQPRGARRVTLAQRLRRSVPQACLLCCGSWRWQGPGLRCWGGPREESSVQEFRAATGGGCRATLSLPPAYLCFWASGGTGGSLWGQVFEASAGWGSLGLHPSEVSGLDQKCLPVGGESAPGVPTRTLLRHHAWSSLPLCLPKEETEAQVCSHHLVPPDRQGSRGWSGPG